VPERFAGKAYLHEEASAEYSEASRRYSDDSPDVAAGFDDEVERGVALIVEHPEAEGEGQVLKARK